MDLICYTYDGWNPRIRPASPKRQWMEETPERFAYRCLPLAIANAHGWEILSPCGFEARWDGSSLIDGIELRLDPNTDPNSAPVSLFGQGTITFHVQGIFRTPPGWNLWVGGSPNSAKDGIAPLAAIVETDWSPYTFTMNWRFTRPGEWVRFEENEPICFLFPVQRDVLPGIQPKIVPIGENGELKGQFEAWSASRREFQAWVEATKPSAPADRWQKLYYRGLFPDGSEGAAGHQSKLRLSPFRHPDGTPLHTEEVNQASSTFGSAEECEPPRPAQTPVAELRRRDWILAASERQRRLTWAGDVERKGQISTEEFLERYYAPCKPVVLQGELADWPALRLWTPDYLVGKIGNAVVEFQGGRADAADFELSKDNHKQRMPFASFVELITKQAGNDAYLTAYNSAENAKALAPLNDDVRPLRKFVHGGPGMIWIGPVGTFTPLHYDLTNNLIAQVQGSKRVILLSPSETQFLYNERHVFSAVHDLMDDERLAQLPLAAQAQAYEVDLEPGEILFVPVGWWHQVTAMDFSVTFTFTDFLWPNDHYKSFPSDESERRG